MEQVHRRRHVAADGEARGLAQRCVEELMPHVEGRREHAVWSPFKRMLPAGIALDGCGAMAGDHDHCVFAEVPHGFCLAARGNFEHEDGHEIAAPLHMGDAARHAVASPMGHRQRAQIKTEIDVDGHAFALRPFQVRVDHEFACRRILVQHVYLTKL